MNIEDVCRIAHEANRALCLTLGDNSQPTWDEAPEWQKESARCGVMAAITAHGGPGRSHENWLRHKLAEGWKYGPVKDPGKKEHPCMVPYPMLPEGQRAKDHLFLGVVHALYNSCGGRLDGLTDQEAEAIREEQQSHGRPIDTGLCA